ncbi:hypothetical protein Syun_026136 [Stephania yunnanensis]|uniref:Uncharacterized protein n=1 Tax=Stephania yunnanensis TaxID=152371 RepID=A0AAP0HWF0_9MAGN
MDDHVQVWSFGTVLATGEANSEDLRRREDDIASNATVAAVSCGGFFTMAITEDGKLWNWGGQWLNAYS